MPCQFSTLGSEGLDILVRARLDFILDLHADYTAEQVAALESGTRDYFERHLAAGDYLGIVGRLGEEVVCSAGLLYYELPPLKSAQSRKLGHVLNFFTRPEHRGAGYGTAMMEYIKGLARREGVGKLVLNATAMGYPVYAACGFKEPEERAMILEEW